MSTILVREPGIDDVHMLSDVARRSFVEAFGHSAPAEVIAEYVATKFSKTHLEIDVKTTDNRYLLLFFGEQLAGYSKIVVNSSHPEIKAQNVTKLDRLYILKQFHGMHFGSQLLKDNIQFSKAAGQAGMWLYVWTQNHQAVDFYKEKQFAVIGRYDFPLSASHANPNHLMFLDYGAPGER